MTDVEASGTEPGQRKLNGPQTTGRTYRNLSEAVHAMTRDDDVPVPLRDGITLLADVHRPAEPGRPLTDASRSRVTPPVEPEMGPVLQGNGLMLTY